MTENTPEPREPAPATEPRPSARARWLPSAPTLALAVAAFGLSAALGVFLLTWGGPGPALVRTTGAARVGGPFELVDHTGKTVTQADYAGKYALIYFGFTYCPDVCPTALQVMTTALDQMGEEAEAVQPLFITIDPERDTVENMAAYVAHFHKRLVGLTGTPEQVARTAAAYKVFYRKVRESGASDYVMEHTDRTYLMGPDGAFLNAFGRTTSPDEMARALSEAVKSGGAD